MDKTGIIVVSICAALLVVWFIQTGKQTAQREQQQAQFAATNKAAATPDGAPTTTASPTPVAPAYVFDTNAPEQLLVLTNRQAHYTNCYTFTSRGGGLKLIELQAYPETISARWTKTKTASDAVASLN